MEKTLTCQWCGASGGPDDFELDEHNGEGFWCPDCDGFTYYDEARNRLRRILLILEQKDGGKADPVPKTALKKRLSPLRYPGGKSKLIDYLAAQFRKESLKTFVEVFAGGASVGLSLLDAGLTERLVINDTDPGVYAFWDSVVHHPEKLLKRLSGSEPNRAEFRSCQQILDSPKGWSQDDLAWATLVCNRLGYSGITKACAMGGKTGSQEQLLSRWNADALQRGSGTFMHWPVKLRSAAWTLSTCWRTVPTGMSSPPVSSTRPMWRKEKAFTVVGTRRMTMSSLP